MITMQQALTANEFWHVSEKNAANLPARCRRNGATQTWKTKPGLFRIPVKYGLKTHFYIQNFGWHDSNAPADKQNRNDAQWCIPALWEAEHVLFEGVRP